MASTVAGEPDGMDSTVMSITRKSLNRGANRLADLIISIKHRVGGGA